MRLLLLVLAAALLLSPARAADLPIFDAHLHYNDEAQSPFPVAKVLELFKRNNVRAILATSRPNDGTRLLLEEAGPDLKVVPFVRPYRVRPDRSSWFKDPEILRLIESELERGIYRGIGEFHLDASADADGEQMKRIVKLSVEKGLWLHAHTDDVAVETLFRHDPEAKVIWAHTGFSTSPERVGAMLEKYPTLMGELSYRGGITDGSGALSPEWRKLFERHSDRFLIGSDTWINQRWSSYDSIIATYRQWLAQLPPEAAERIAYRNGERLFLGK
jgi:Tat protein secretion system quality control protein TatD with DNase activity